MNKFINWRMVPTIAMIFMLVFNFPTPAINASEPQTQIEIDQSTLNQELETPGVLRVGMEANYAPFNWSQTNDNDGAIAISNSNGEYANGYDVQMAKLIADRLGLKLEIVKSEWDGLPPAVQSGKIDAIIAGMSPTPERLEQIDFSNSYYDSNIVLVVRKDSPYAQAKSLADFNGAKVTGQLNTFHYDLIEQIPGVDQQTALDSFPTMISSVLSGKSDAYVSEKPGALAAVAANDELSFVEFPPNQGFDLGQLTTDISVGLRKNSKLTPVINEVLATIPQADRDQLMEDMVALNERGESKGFWSDVSNIWSNFGSQFIRGAANTMFIALSSTVIGFLLGLVIAIIRSLKVKKQENPVSYYLYRLIDFIIAAYIEIFRGTPMMVQAMLIFYGSKLFFNFDLSSMKAALLIVSINTAAYLAEVIRGGINSVDQGQTEAAKAIGMNHVQTMSYVVLPQAIRSILPSIGNEFVINIKDTSVLNVIAVTELFFVTRSAAGSTYQTFQTFFIAAVIYFVLTFTTTRILNLVEKHMYKDTSSLVLESSTLPHPRKDQDQV
ncbi:amino acid ABC transporter permease [Aerococcus urinaehominis]|uniref:Amino acid ABC transporter permease n=1 Tax=Aerococcus urinaehominis TaxID=128944 RepID=A0A120IAQ6_9LACT|nr:ABC transporter permease subunit [Aerococcus urinaehominis]AMB98798.1 amino acid ABC transporter permease [Aerococcus urinaehominis]SDM12273.1 putative lysine transport system permease protein [Aerococcus urinaehominis]